MRSGLLADLGDVLEYVRWTSDRCEPLRALDEFIKLLAAIGAHHTDSALLSVKPDRISVLDRSAPLVGQVQPAAFAPGRRIHDDKLERQKSLQVARQRRLLDVERITDFDRRYAVAVGKLCKQRELARCNPIWPQGVVIHPGDDPAELAHP